MNQKKIMEEYHRWQQRALKDQDIVNELRGVPGAKCYSTLDSAMRTLRITCTAREQMKALRESRK